MPTTTTEFGPPTRKLVDAAYDRARLFPGARVLEIGCGTGKLTAMLAARGLRVDAVDPGPALLETARRRVGDGNVHFHLGRFEDIGLPDESFAAAFSATAFHWVDPAVGWSKVAAVLAPRGVLALLQTGLPALVREFDRAVWRSVLPDEEAWPATDPFHVWSEADARRDDVSALWSWLARHNLENPKAADLFDDVRVLTVPVPLQYSAESYLALMSTASTYLRLRKDRRAALDRGVHKIFAAAGGTDHWVDYATLVTARQRTEQPGPHLE
ncbi:MAG: class I SAM-dependent methyltransferase [Gaiellaceae bacterium]